MPLIYTDFQQCTWFLLENLWISKPSLSVLEKFQSNSAVPNIKYNCTILFLCEMYCSFVYALKYIFSKTIIILLICSKAHQIYWSSCTVLNIWFCLAYHEHFFKKKFGGYTSVLWATDTPILDFWWCLHWVSKTGWAHLWCDTCWPLGSQYGSHAFSSMYLQAGIGGAGTGIYHAAVHSVRTRQADERSTDWAMPTAHSESLSIVFHVS